MSATMLNNIDDEITFNDKVETVKRFTLRVLSTVVAQAESKKISARSSTMNTYTAKAGDSRIVENHPLIPVYGRFRNDPTWDRYMQNIEEYGQEADALARSRE